MGEESVWESLQNIWIAMSPVEWWATVFSIIYVILAAKQNIWCWFFGIIGVVLSFYVYQGARLYSDATLQVFYLVMSFYGWYNWNKEKKEEKLPISTWTWTQHLKAIAIGLLFSALAGAFWAWNGAALPYIDALTTSFSVIATFMVTRKILENWIYWIIIDFACVFIYFHREIYLFSFLFLIYCIIAVFGYFKWKANLRPKISSNT